MNSVIGLRSRIQEGTTLDGVVVMGADFYETPEQRSEHVESGIPAVGIGESSTIRRAIIDTNARIGRGCSIGSSSAARADGAYENYHVRDGIIIIPKNSVLPDNTVI